ncbi:MAG TPA: tetratricopeptide repeat protein [Bacteroidales bacterium]|nr:tetratricopeptide repeat protein [Bacteroidales bacterium]
MCPKLASQSKIEIRNIFYEAESWILFEDYKEALPLYQQLLRINPINSNIKYRIGQCYINSPGEKEKSISFLEDAVKNINPDYKEGKLKETGAPYDALYYLANAYRINNQLDKALEYYKAFKKNLNPIIYDSGIVNLQIESCLNALKLMEKPLYIREVNLSNRINDDNSEFNPVVSKDEDLIIFSRSEAFYDAIMFATKNNSDWNGPMNMNELLKVDRDLFPTSLSSDKKTLYLYSSANYDGIIYSSKFENGSWQAITKLNDNINTKYWESHATISNDNKRLYFTSNRKGTYGGLDIYVSERDSTGDWGPARNLGPVINTPYNEESPFLSQDDKILYFSSRGHFNMGGYDIFSSVIKPDGTLSEPVNVGYPLNSTDDDVFFKPVKDGYEGYVAKEEKSGYGKQDIYRIEIFSDDHPRKFLVSGMVKVTDLLSNFADSVKVSAMNIKNPDQTVVTYSDPESGEYSMELPHGKYEMTYEADKAEKIKKELELALNFPVDSFVLPGTILPKTDFVADMDIESNKSLKIKEGESILFPINVEPNSLLKIEHWADDSLLYSEEFIVKDSLFNYETSPSAGENKIVFKLTDKFGNITSADVFITKEKEAPVIRPEYEHVIARKQVEAFTSMLESRSTGDVKKLISDSDADNQKFSNIDELLTMLKEEALKKNISSEEIDKLALRVAVMDNILTQTAVDYMAKNTDGALRKILEDLDIYKANLKTWTDLQQYIFEKTNGDITPEELNEIASFILSDSDPGIPVIREKILTYNRYSGNDKIINDALQATDNSKIKLKEKWLSTFYNEALKAGLTNDQIARLLAAISGMPGSTAADLLEGLMKYADEPLLTSLHDLDLSNQKIKTPADLIAFLLGNKDKTKYPEDLILKALSTPITEKNIPEEAIAAQSNVNRTKFPWIIVLIAGGLLLAMVIVTRRKKKKENRK